MRLVITPLLALLLAVLFGASMRAGGDIAAPVFVGAVPQRPQIDTSNSAQTITFTVHVTDDLSGIHYGFIRWMHDRAYNTVRDCTWYVNGTVTREIFAPCGVTFPRYSATGTWLVQWMIFEDNVGNKLNLITADPIFSDGKVIGYEYNEEATSAIRAMEITIGDPMTTTDPPLYLPSIMAN